MTIIKSKDMEPYNKEATCPKCGHDDVGTGYHNGFKCRFGCGYNGPWISEEHILRNCRNCHYEWHQKPIEDK